MDAAALSTTCSSNAYGRSLKYELIYPGDFASGQDLFTALDNYFRFCNHRRPHHALGYRTPAELFPHRFKSKRSSS